MTGTHLRQWWGVDPAREAGRIVAANDTTIFVGAPSNAGLGVDNPSALVLAPEAASGSLLDASRRTLTPEASCLWRFDAMFLGESALLIDGQALGSPSASDATTSQVGIIQGPFAGTTPFANAALHVQA